MARRINPKGVAASLLAVVIGGGIALYTGNITDGTKIRTDYPVLAEEKAYTLLIYMNGSDLETYSGAATEDLREIAAALSANPAADANTHIVVEAGGTLRWHMPGLEGVRNARFTVGPEGVRDVAHITDRDMSHPNTLTDFISYGTRSYPARDTLLLFWNHGGGAVQGFGSDELYRYGSLTLPELEAALAHPAVILKKFGLIGFDACLMGTVETAGALRDFADYMAASQELEPVSGWDYGWVSILKTPGLSGEEIGRNIADSYIAAGFGGQSASYPLTLSVIRLSEIDELERQIDLLFQDIGGDGIFRHVSQNRDGLRGYGQNRGLGLTPEIVDLLELADICADPGLLLGQIERTVAYNRTTAAGQPGCGLTVYLPSGDSYSMEQNIALYKQTRSSASYRRFVAAYGDFLRNPKPWDFGEPDCVAEFDNDGVLSVTLGLEGVPFDDIAGVYLTLFSLWEDDIYTLIGTDSAVELNPNGYAQASFDRYWPELEGMPICSIERLVTGEDMESVSPVLHNGELSLLVICFDLYGQGYVTGVEPLSVEGAPGRLSYLRPGDVIRPLYPLEDFGAGALENIADDRIYMGQYTMGSELEIDEWANPQVYLAPLPDETEIILGFTIQDVWQQRVFTEFIDVPAS